MEYKNFADVESLKDIEALEMSIVEQINMIYCKI